MTAEFDASASKKCRVQIFDTDKYVFCPEPFTAEEPGIYPDVHKVQSLWSASTERQDDMGKQLLSKKSEILSGKITFQYHKSCRSTYTNSLHLKGLAEKRSDGSSSVCFTRSHSTESFDWKQNCFLCGLQCFPKLLMLHEKLCHTKC